jgi:hypothetical protein
VRPVRPDRIESRARARPQDVVLGDQRAVEVGRDRGDLGGKAVRQPQEDFVVRNLTRSLICESVSLPLYTGITPFGKLGTT